MMDEAQKLKRVRLSVERVDEPYMDVRVVGEDTVLRLDVTVNHHTMRASQLLQEGMQVNALSAVLEVDVLRPQLIVVEPDFLLDTTSVTSCIKGWGESAFNYFLAKFKPSESTVHTLLGDFANQFLDDILNLPDADYLTSMHKVFADKAIDICACKEINASFFEETKRQFANIQQIVRELTRRPYMHQGKVNIHIEPSFFCEALGLQGRMDCLIDLEEGKKFLIELKSGKWNEFFNKAKEEHLMQMLLYKEILYYNMDVKQADVMGHLLYSKYPYLQEQQSYDEMVLRAMNIRNSMVAMERGLMDGKAREWVPKLTPQALRQDARCSDKFWTVWCLPELQSMTDTLHNMDELTAEYFYAFLQFIEREQAESKICETGVNASRSLSALWLDDLETKRENGDIFLNLHLSDLRMKDGVDAVCLSHEGDDESPNFRIGDAVILYKRNSEEDSVVSQQVFRCNVEAYDCDRIWLQLKNVQRNKDIFCREDLYAIEHDHVDANFRSLYSGLFSLLTCEKSRRDLLLCQRTPTKDDMFLLMGPPGTGKTSVALKRMVEEELESGHNILLLAYTNRAVDEICQMLETIERHATSDYVRLGRELSCAPQYQERLLSHVIANLTNRKQVTQKIQDTSIFVSTVASMNSHTALFRLKHFHVAIFDEASQILEPQILGILTSSAIDKFIMIGDHKQLPAVVVQNEEKSAVSSPLLHEIGLTNCRNSFFQRLYERNRDNRDVVAMLDHQGRMHPSIADFASDAFYEGRLLPVGLPHQLEELPYIHYDLEDPIETLVATHRCAFINVPLPFSEDRMPKANVWEARMIAQLVKGIVSLHQQNDLQFDPWHQLGIIVPFRRQIALVRAEIAKILPDVASDIVIDTVERYQGSQRDIIIYGTTITQLSELDILSNLSETSSGLVDRKLNVAVTRARKQLFVLGNEKLLCNNVLYAKLIDYCKKS